jgi:hypothetical protein
LTNDQSKYSFLGNKSKKIEKKKKEKQTKPMPTRRSIDFTQHLLIVIVHIYI